MDKIERFLAYNGKINIVCIKATDLVEEARKIHDLSPVVTAALGRTLIISAIMGANLKGEQDKLTVQINGDGPIGKIIVSADSNAKVKGYVQNTKVDIPLREDGKLNVGAAVGKNGFLYVIKDIGLKEPYNGMSKLISGEIAEDFTNYFYTSEQTNSAVALGVLVDKNGVKSAGGYMVSCMPDATEDELFILEERIKEAKPISQMLDENMTLEEIAKDLTGDINIKKLDNEIIPKYECDCSKEKMERALNSIGKEELKNIIEEDKKAEIICHFCNKKYIFNEEELKKLL